MAKPVILAVDDDPQVLRAVERDLRRNYAREYRGLRADSGHSALDTLEKVRERGDPVALMLVDQRMPRMSGVEFLEEARGMFPNAKRALLTAYADTDAAIRATNNNVLHYYLQKPWDPPEERLYPTLDDLLESNSTGWTRSPSVPCPASELRRTASTPWKRPRWRKGWTLGIGSWSAGTTATSGWSRSRAIRASRSVCRLTGRTVRRNR